MLQRCLPLNWDPSAPPPSHHGLQLGKQEAAQLVAREYASVFPQMAQSKSTGSPLRDYTCSCFLWLWTSVRMLTKELIKSRETVHNNPWLPRSQNLYRFLRQSLEITVSLCPLRRLGSGPTGGACDSRHAIDVPQVCLRCAWHGAQRII